MRNTRIAPGSDDDLKELIVSTFIQGSYRRFTGTRPQDSQQCDVDIIAVTTMHETDYKPKAALEKFRAFLKKHYLGMYLLQGRSWGINVCDDEIYFQSKVRHDMRDWKARYGAEVDVDAIPVHVIDGYVGKGYAQASDEVLACIAELARMEGVVLDPVYTGKAFYGLSQEIRQGRFDGCSDIVFIHTGGIFGLYAYEEPFNRLLND